MIDTAVVKEMQQAAAVDIDKAKATALAIVDRAGYDDAAKMLLTCKERMKSIKDRMAEPKQKAHQAWRSVCDLEGQMLEPYERIEREIVKPAMLKWEEVEEHRRRLRQEEANRIAREMEEARRLEQAAELERSGKTEEAEAVIDAPPPQEEIVIPKTTEHKGISYRTNYSAEVVSIQALCLAVAEGRCPTQYITANTSALNAIARSLKESVIPQWETMGLKLKTERIISAGVR